jgi:hypothetical protein
LERSKVVAAWSSRAIAARDGAKRGAAAPTVTGPHTHHVPIEHQIT